MSKFAVGEMVDSAADDHEGGPVIAVFPTVDGNFRYAVDMEGYGRISVFRRGKTGRPPVLHAGALTGALMILGRKATAPHLDFTKSAVLILCQPLPGWPEQRTLSDRPAWSVPCRYCCKSRKSNDAQNLAKVDFHKSLSLQRSIAPIRGSVVDFG